MSRLIAAGRLEAPSLFIPGYVNTKRKATISYRTCGVRDPNEKRKTISPSQHRVSTSRFKQTEPN